MDKWCYHNKEWILYIVFLRRKLSDVSANNIYKGIFDTNKPKNKSAEVSYIEKLWKKRLRLLGSPLEWVFYYLLKRDEWLNVSDDSSVTHQYYKDFPEFIMEHFGCDDRNEYENYLFGQKDRFIWKIFVYYIWKCRIYIGKMLLKRNMKMHWY